ncbi:hypothetical protein ACFLVO_01205 [Chloroflexota bacterium]
MSIIWKSLVLVLLVSFMGIIPSCSYSQDNGELTNQYNTLVQKHNDLIQEYNNLLEQNNGYREDREQLLNELSNYQSELNTALEEYESELTTALEGAIVPPYITMNGRKASYSFRNLDNKIESWSYDVETLEANTIIGTFMRNVSISDLNRIGLSDIAQKFINGSKYVNLGGEFTCVDSRPYLSKENFQNDALGFYSRHTDDESRVKEVWNMVTQLCPYTGEMKETPRLPLETLLFGGGDCEDLAILTASILKAISSDWTIQLVYMDSNSPTSCKTVNHVSVFVDTGEYKNFVECTQKSIMSPYESVDGYYVNVP